MAQIDIQFDDHKDSPIKLPLDCYVRVSSFASDGDGFPMLTSKCVSADEFENEVGRLKTKLDQIVATAKSRYERS
jgi:hypothetical protein